MSPDYEIALTRAERSLVNAPEMVMDNTNINEIFGTDAPESMPQNQGYVKVSVLP